MITVVIVDDHPIVRAGMRAVLDSAEDIVVLAEGGKGAEAIQLTQKYNPDVLVLDINLPDLNGLEVTYQLREQQISTGILILTAHDDPKMVFGLLENGATGYVLKDEALETLGHAVRAAASGETWLSPTVASQVVRRAVRQQQPHTTPKTETMGEALTPREMQVLRLLAEGFDNTAIAKQLMVTKRTVQNHVSNIYSKLGVTARTEAMLYAIRRGWAQVSSKGSASDDP